VFENEKIVEKGKREKKKKKEKPRTVAKIQH